jgi:CheY-like chemotaxis protein
VLVHTESVLRRLADDLSGAIRVVGDQAVAEFVAVVRSERPCVVALDVHAPERGAWLTMCELQMEPETAGVPILLFAHDDDIGEAATKLGLLHVLSRPLSVERASQLLLTLAPDEPTPSVLIADEDAEVRHLLGQAARSAGGDVRTAASGAEALDLARRAIPHIVVMDLLMPGMNGIEVLAAMRREPALEHVQIVALVPCEASDEDIERLRNSVENLGGWRDRRFPLADIIGRAVAAVRSGDARAGAAA